MNLKIAKIQGENKNSNDERGKNKRTRLLIKENKNVFNSTPYLCILTALMHDWSLQSHSILLNINQV